MKILTVIPAKGTSSRVPNKNMQDLGGKPLFRWTVDAAIASGVCGTIVVSTDDDEIAALSDDVTVLRRPPELCRDPAQMPEVALHALEHFPDRDVVMVLLPTSPFRTHTHIEAALMLHCSETPRRNVVSVLASGMAHKALTVGRYVEQGPSIRDERMPPIVLLTGAIWLSTPERLRADGHISALGAIPFCLDGPAALDIDTPADLEAARAVL